MLWDNRSHRRTPVQRTPLSAAAHTVSQASVISLSACQALKEGITAESTMLSVTPSSKSLMCGDHILTDYRKAEPKGGEGSAGFRELS